MQGIMSEKYIYFRCGKWSVEIKGKLYGRFSSKEDARNARDKIIQELSHVKNS